MDKTRLIAAYNRRVQAAEDEAVRQKRIRSTKSAAKVIIVNLVIIAILIAYTFVGAYLFMELEQPNEKLSCISRETQYNIDEQDAAVKLLAISTSYLKVNNVEMWLKTLNEQVKAYRDGVVQTLKYDGLNCSDLGEPGGRPYSWNLMSALLFSVTIYTTIGYGNIVPLTNWGRFLVFPYAIIGIPIMFICLSSIGEIMANVCRFIYCHVCCLGYCVERKRKRHTQQKPVIIRPVVGRGPGWVPYIVDDSNDKDDDDDDDDDEGSEDNVVSVPMSVALVLIATFVFLGTVLFANWEGWDNLQAAYYCFITITTIGFGDVVPGFSTGSSQNLGSNFEMVGAIVYMVLGMALMAMGLDLIQYEMAQKMTEMGGENLGVMGATVDEITGHSVDYVNQQVGLKNPHQYGVQFNDSDKHSLAPNYPDVPFLGSDEEDAEPHSLQKKQFLAHVHGSDKTKVQAEMKGHLKQLAAEHIAKVHS